MRQVGAGLDWSGLCMAGQVAFRRIKSRSFTMVARVERKGHAIHTCKKCGRTDDDYGEWFWKNAACDECSDCFPVRRRDIKGVTYCRQVPDSTLSDIEYYRRTTERARKSRMATLLEDMQRVLVRPRTVAFLAANLGVDKESIRTRIHENPDLFVCVRQARANHCPALWQLKAVVDVPLSPDSSGVLPVETTATRSD